MSLGQFITVLRARWRVALGVLAAVVLVTVVLSLVLPAQYTATTSVVVDFKPDPVSTVMLGGQTPPSVMATQVDVILSERVAQRVVRDLKLSENADIRQQWLDETQGQGSIEQWLGDVFIKKLDVQPSRESSVISIGYKAPDPRFAAAVTNAFASAYMKTMIELRTDPARRYAGFFDARAKEARDALEKAQSRLSAFQKANGIVASDERLDVETARLNELSSQLVAVQALTAESTSRQAQARGAQADRLQEVLTSPLIASLKTDINRGEARLQELGTRYGDNHPQVLEAKANLAELRARLDAETLRVTSGVAVTNSINQQRAAQIGADLEAQRAKVLRLKAVRDEGQVLVSDVTNAQRAYDAVQARLQQTNLESQTTQTNVNVLSTALPPIDPSFPILWLNVLLAVVIGGALGASTALLLELMDRRVRSAEDAVMALELPLLAVLPGAKNRPSQRRRQMLLAHQRLLGALPPAGKNV